MTLPNHVIVYPAHGAGLHGKNLGSDTFSTIGTKPTNYALQPMSKEDLFKN